MTPAETRLERLLARVPIGMRTNPFELWIAIQSAISGVLYVGAFAQSTALANYVPHWAGRLWGVSTLLASLCLFRGLTSMADVGGAVVMLPRAVPAYKLGLRLFICTSLVYGPAVLFTAPNAAAAAPYFALAFSAAVRLLVMRAAAARMTTIRAARRERGST